MSVEAGTRHRGVRDSAMLVLIFGAGLVMTSAWLGLQLATLLYSGLRAPGYISSNEQRISNGREGFTKVMFYPTVGFNDVDGNHHRFTDGVGTGSPSYAEGEKVTVLYRRGDPAASAIIDRGVWNWFLPGWMFAVGALLVGLSRGQMRRAGTGVRRK